jgi:glycosyltransferase involved in cell wall biosynthesis
VLLEPDLRVRLGRTAAAVAAERFDVSVMAAEYAALYRRLRSGDA